jgi:hypothetical protein
MGIFVFLVSIVLQPKKAISIEKKQGWQITWLQAMHNTAMAGEFTWLS